MLFKAVMNFRYLYYLPSLALMLAAGACSDEKITDEDRNQVAELPEWYYAGGELGTTLLSTTNAYEQPAPAVHMRSWC